MTEVRENNIVLSKTLAVSYLRTATVDEIAIEEQKEECAEFAKSKGLEIIKVFADNGFSGHTVERPAIQNLMDFCRDNSNSIEYVIVDKLDRISSSLEGWMYIEGTLRNHGVTIFSINESSKIGITESYNRHMNLIYKEERKEISLQKRKRNMIAKIKRGRWVWAIPYGYTSFPEARSIKPDGIDGEIVKTIFEKVTNNCSDSDILNFCKTQDVEMKPKQLLKMLTNPIYCGYIYKPEFLEEAVKGAFMPIVAVELFNKVQDVLGDKGLKIRIKEDDN